MRAAHNIINPILKRLLSFKHPAIDAQLEKKFEKLLEFALTKKDASYIELFVSHIVAQKPALLGKFSENILSLVKLKEEGGPRTDLHRLRALEMMTKAIYKILQRKDEEELENLSLFLKGTSKEVKKLLVSVAANHTSFKVKKIAILRKYLEFGMANLRAFDQLGMAKRFSSLKETLSTIEKELPSDPVLAKQLKKLADTQPTERK